MSEMLGNRYFLVRNFQSATLQFEESLNKNNQHDYELIKKLIICYTKVNRTDDALKKFYLLLNELQHSPDDIRLKDEDCPCAEIIEEINTEVDRGGLQYSSAIKLAILNSYCSYSNGIKYFKKSLKFSRNINVIKKIIKILESKKQRTNN